MTLTQHTEHRTRRRLRFVAGMVMGVAFAANAAEVSAAETKVAVFSGLDKITAEIVKIEAPVDEPAQFGTLQILVRTCNKRPPEETPETTAFVEISEQRANRESAEPVFTGWMFASSPGLNALEHPVYDVWLTNCRISAEEVSPASR